MRLANLVKVEQRSESYKVRGGGGGGVQNLNVVTMWVIFENST